ncbi:MAG: 50S ribosomal protein L29 [Opitutales bacterium]|nr:50S ribosomal protein L29 [Opitutales bacterium]|tara:strand:+ start:143 stop:373 length:231 start_codon:yes stop_codon:yes gene_type:complete
MKSTQVRELSLVELEKKLRDVGKELVDLRLRKQAGQVENSSLLCSLRRDIARLNTIRIEKNAQPRNEAENLSESKQ